MFTPVARSESRGPLTLRLAGGVLAIGLFAWAFHAVDLERVASLLGAAGSLGVVLIALPQLCGLSLECVGWRAVLLAWQRQIRFLPLLRIRLMTEALAQTLPMGVVFAESIKPALLERSLGVPLSEGVAAVAVRKYLLLLAHSAYVLTMCWAGRSTLHAASVYFFGRGGLEWVMLGSGILLGVMALLLASAVGRGHLAGRAYGLLNRIPIERLKRALAGAAAGFKAADGAAERFFRVAPARAALPAVPMFLGWVCESLEAYLILHLLGVKLDLATIASIEVTLSLLRNLAFLVPAGLGVQDAGYVAFLTALRVPDAISVGAAFAILRRSKELFWASIGYSLLAFEVRGPLLRGKTLHSALGVDRS
jgi:glycosyltransferase 2 family protein